MKLFNFFIIFLFLGVINLYSNNLIIESEGFSIISDNLNQSRQNAIDDAITKGIEKFLKNRGIQLNKSLEEQIKSQAVSGYEIIKEEVDGNILKEKIKLLLDENSLNDFIQPSSKDLIKVDIFAVLNGNFDNSLIDLLENFLKNNFDYNFIFYPITNIENLTNDSNIKLSLKINLNKIKKLLSVNSYLYNLNGEIEIYDKQNNLYDNLTFTKNLILRSDKDYINYLSSLINPFIKKNFSKLITEVIKNTVTSNNLLYVILKNIKNFNVIEEFQNFLEKINLKYSLIEISKGEIVYKVEGISKNNLKNLLNSKNFNFKIREKEGKDEELF